MARFLVEVAHETETLPCARVVHVFLTTGSHYLTHADWGCRDGVHKSWFIAEVNTKEEAQNIVPAAFRSEATVIQLNDFTVAEIEHILKQHNV